MTAKYRTVHILWTGAYITSICNIRHPPVCLDLDNYINDSTDRVWFEQEGYEWCEKCESKLSPLQQLAALDL